jgi:hypothetical protein
MVPRHEKPFAGAVGVAIKVMVLVGMIVLMSNYSSYKVIQSKWQVDLVEDVIVK